MVELEIVENHAGVLVSKLGNRSAHRALEMQGLVEKNSDKI